MAYPIEVIIHQKYSPAILYIIAWKTMTLMGQPTLYLLILGWDSLAFCP